ncbi:MAG: hypothetical protein PHE72_14685, partial [candidate division Zixibacteria bacterium]|nr:hypothetical protein [candidate division Zixibacteria bacterium]
KAAGERASVKQKAKIEPNAGRRTENARVYAAVHRSFTDWVKQNPQATDAQIVEKYNNLIRPAAEKNFMDSRLLMMNPTTAPILTAGEADDARGAFLEAMGIEEEGASYEAQTAKEAGRVVLKGANGQLVGTMEAPPEGKAIAVSPEGAYGYIDESEIESALAEGYRIYQ